MGPYEQPKRSAGKRPLLPPPPQQQHWWQFSLRITRLYNLMKRLSDHPAWSLWFRQKEREAQEERKGTSERCWGYKCLSRTTYTPAARVPPHSMNSKEGESRNVLQRTTKNNEQFGIETFGDSGSVSAVMHGIVKMKQNENVQLMNESFWPVLWTGSNDSLRRSNSDEWFLQELGQCCFLAIIWFQKTGVYHIIHIWTTFIVLF